MKIDLTALLALAIVTSVIAITMLDIPTITERMAERNEYAAMVARGEQIEADLR